MLSNIWVSIRQKLQGIVIVSCGAALVIATVIFTLYDHATFLAAKTNDLVTTARMIGANSTAALTFGDRNSAPRGVERAASPTSRHQRLHL